MSAMQLAVQDVLSALYQQRDDRDIWVVFTRAVEVAEQASADDGNWTLLALAELLAHPQCPFPALLACLSERGIAAGGDPGIGLGLITTRVYDTLLHADQFVQACQYQMETTGNTDLAAAQGIVAQQRPRDAMGYAELILACSGTAPLLNHFVDARQLFRSLPDCETILNRLVSVHPAVADLAKTLADHDDPRLTLDDYNQAVDQALDNLRSLPVGDERAVHQALGELMRVVFCVQLEVRKCALRGLAEIIPVCDVGNAGVLAQLCGSFVEMGADPLQAIDAILGRLPEVLTLAGRFVDACVAATGDATNPHECVQQHGVSVAARLPLEARALTAVHGVSLGTIALLSRSVEKRREVQQREDLLPLAMKLAPVSGPASFLCKMVQVLDDETLIVLAPAQKLGWRVRIRGVADNFQLHTLLAGSVVGSAERGLYPQRAETSLDPRSVEVASFLPCREREASVSSFLQLLTYKGLRAAGTIANESEHFIWNEGVPADIPTLDGTRIVLLTEASYVRTWNGGRIFRGMRGDLRLEETLTPAVVEDWLQRLRAANA